MMCFESPSKLSALILLLAKSKKFSSNISSALLMKSGIRTNPRGTAVLA